MLGSISTHPWIMSRKPILVVPSITNSIRPKAQLFLRAIAPSISLSVAFILFEGGLTHKLYEVVGLEQVVRNLITIGLLSTWLVTAATHWLVGFRAAWHCRRCSISLICRTPE